MFYMFKVNFKNLIYSFTPRTGRGGLCCANHLPSTFSRSIVWIYWRVIWSSGRFLLCNFWTIFFFFPLSKIFSLFQKFFPFSQIDIDIFPNDIDIFPNDIDIILNGNTCCHMKYRLQIMCLKARVTVVKNYPQTKTRISNIEVSVKRNTSR